jgi:DNA-binding transcriptional MerR regulator
MNRFTIRDIENLCGIKAHTLRIWEQRYKIFVPKRTIGKHRIYSDEDLKELLRISFLYHNNYKISKIAELNKEQIKQEVEAVCIRENNYPVFISQLIEASVDLDKEKFEKIVNSIVLRIGLEKSIKGVFCPFLNRIGLLWMTNHVIPAQEHFASHILRKKIICAIDGLDMPTNPDHQIVLFTPEGEHHEIPLLIVNYYLRKQNIKTIYFGTNVPMKAIEFYSSRQPVTHLYMHITTNICNSNLQQMILDICNDFSDKKVMISGPAIKCIQTKPLNLCVIGSLDEMINFACCPESKN